MVVAAALAVLLAGLPLAATAVAYVAGRGRGETAAEPLGATSVVAAFVREWLSVVALLIAWPLRLTTRPGRGAKRGVAVFVPELRCSSAAFWYLRRQLGILGWEGIAGLDRTRSSDVQDAITDLDARLASLPPGAEIVFIGHGVGGLLAYRYASVRPTLHVRHVITLGTPHRGSRALPYRMLGAVLAPVSSEARVDVIALYSDFDAWLQPVDDAYCGGAFNIAVRGIGHCAMLLSGRVAELIAENLAAPVRSRASTE